MTQREWSARWLVADVLLHRDARLLRPHFLRATVLAWVFMFAVLPAATTRTKGAPGLYLLTQLTIALCLASVGEASRVFNRLLDDEWTAYNLELLQLTGISPAELIFAKALPQWCTGLSAMLLTFPVALLAVTLGGVTYTQVIAVYGLIIVLYLLVSAMALLGNAIVNNVSYSSLLSFAVGLLYFAPLGVIDYFRISPAAPNGTSPPLLFPAFEFFRILDSTYKGSIVSWPVVIHLGTVVGLCWISGRLLSRRWHFATEQAPEEPVSTEQPINPQPLWRPMVNPPRCDNHPIVWKDYYFTLGSDEMQYGKWIVLGLTALMAAALAWLVHPAVLWLFVFLGIFGAIGVLTYSAQRLWQMELQERTLEALCLVPWPTSDIVYAKLRALTITSLPEALVFVVTVAGLIIVRQWEVAWCLCYLAVSMPIIVCTDAGWRFIPRTWQGLTSRCKLVGIPLGVWVLSGVLGVFVHPAVGLVVLSVGVPFVCRIVLADCAHWLPERASE
ncbi:hypothetical protein GC163_04615 [bacterium]|nr:hypothetical protein [bacterium]